VNKCDIEEVKFQARQKFLNELSKDPSKWKNEDYLYCSDFRANLDEWKISVHEFGDGPQVFVLGIGYTQIAVVRDENDEVAVAIKTIRKWHKDKQDQKRCERLQRAIQESCQKIQAVLNPPKEPEVKHWWNFLRLSRSKAEKPTDT